jgi:glycerol-3-phosphate dehydrogenase
LSFQSSGPFAHAMSFDPHSVWDLLVIGGGATGLGVALQAALEGRKVLLVEARDFASGTSSRSTKLLHGGVRYLAQGRLRLVYEALRERSTVLGLAPHLAQPLSFVVPAGSRWSWAWTVLGLKVYQWLSGRLSLGSTAAISRGALARCASNLPLLSGRFVGGVRYWDGQFEDARLALALAKTARRAGASVHNHTRVTALDFEPLSAFQSQADNVLKGAKNTQMANWRVGLLDERTGQARSVQAACVVNATGVWVDALRQMALSQGANSHESKTMVTPSQGVHMVVSRACLPIQEAVLIPKTSDGRVLFAVPWLGSTVIGTTDTPRSDAPFEPLPLQEELDFLFSECQKSLGVTLTPADIRSVWVGLRPLVGGSEAGVTSQMSREHLIQREAQGFYTVTGGKWTTYRIMAEEVMQAIQSHADLPQALPGQGDTRQHRLVGAPESHEPKHPISEAPGLHLWGTEAEQVLALPGAKNHLGMGLTEAMVRFSARNEWVFTVEDMLARRWRALFLDARQAALMAPSVASLLQEETGLDPKLDDFLALCRRYTLAS